MRGYTTGGSGIPGYRPEGECPQSGTSGQVDFFRMIFRMGMFVAAGFHLRGACSLRPFEHTRAQKGSRRLTLTGRQEHVAGHHWKEAGYDPGF